MVAAVIGNWLEAFDFAVYGFFAITIGKLFFPVADPTSQLLLSVATFAAGFLARPLGSVLLGMYADKKGRRAALSLTIFLMGLGTVAFGLAPTYQQSGVAGSLIIVFARLLQGFSQGGEFGAATAMMAENGAAGSRGFRASWQLASQGAAGLLGAGAAELLTSILSSDDLLSWGWRIPFLAGGLIAPVGIYLRRAIPERANSASSSQAETGILRELFRAHKRTLALLIFTVMGGTVSNYILLFYMPTYAIHTLGLPQQTSLWIAMVSGAVMLVVAPMLGAWSDRLRSRKRPMFIGRGTLVVLLFPAFWAFGEYPTLQCLLPIAVVLIVFYSMGSAPQFSLMTEVFPHAVRATGISIAYTCSTTLFGGTAQLVATWLIKSTDSALAPAAYVAACLLVSLAAVSRLQERSGDDLNELAAIESGADDINSMESSHSDKSLSQTENVTVFASSKFA